jgi:hypothetical protein
MFLVALVCPHIAFSQPVLPSRLASTLISMFQFQACGPQKTVRVNPMNMTSHSLIHPWANTPLTNFTTICYLMRYVPLNLAKYMFW